jgi:hypothetical protein
MDIGIEKLLDNIEKNTNETVIEILYLLEKLGGNKPTKSFIRLLSGNKLDGLELKTKLLHKTNKDVYKVIYEALEESLRSRATNTSIVLLSSRNSELSEIMEDLKITSYKSILENFKDFNIISKESASNSIIISAMFNQDQIYFKVFPIGKIYNTDGLVAEKIYYSELFKLVKYNVTPNILCTVATSKISNFNEDFVEKNPHLKPRIMVEINKNNERYEIPIDTVWIDTDVIITQSGGNKLKDVYKTLHPEELKNILFQIFYTLYVFEKIEFSHGDLYSWNIFIQDIPETELCYLVGRQIFRFRTTKLVKIYDFDNSTLCKDTEITFNTTEKIKITHYLNPNREIGTLLNKLGATNIFNKNLDITMFCLMLDNDISDFFQRCFPGLSNSEKIGDTYLQDPLINEDISNMSWKQYFTTIQNPRYSGRIVKNVRKMVLNNHILIPDNIIIPKLDMLLDPYFETLHSDIPIDVRKEIVYSIDNR